MTALWGPRQGGGQDEQEEDEADSEEVVGAVDLGVEHDRRKRKKTP